MRTPEPFELEMSDKQFERAVRRLIVAFIAAPLIVSVVLILVMLGGEAG